MNVLWSIHRQWINTLISHSNLSFSYDMIFLFYIFIAMQSEKVILPKFKFMCFDMF